LSKEPLFKDKDSFRDGTTQLLFVFSNMPWLIENCLQKDCGEDLAKSLL
jgi:hypothetical protein